MSEGFAAGLRRAAEIARQRSFVRRTHADKLFEMDYAEAQIDAKTVSAKADEAEGIADQILAAIPAPAPWTPPDDRADGFECLGWRREGEWEPVKWLAYMDRWWWIFTDNATGQPTAFAPLPPVPESQP